MVGDGLAHAPVVEQHVAQLPDGHRDGDELPRRSSVCVGRRSMREWVESSRESVESSRAWVCFSSSRICSWIRLDGTAGSATLDVAGV